MMSSTKTEATTSDALAGAALESGAESTDPLNHLFALLPSADQLRRVAAGAALSTSDHSKFATGDTSESLEIPRSLLNPLETLPRPLSIEEMKKQVHAASAPPTQAH